MKSHHQYLSIINVVWWNECLFLHDVYFLNMLHTCGLSVCGWRCLMSGQLTWQQWAASNRLVSNPTYLKIRHALESIKAYLWNWTFKTFERCEVQSNVETMCPTDPDSFDSQWAILFGRIPIQSCQQKVITMNCCQKIYGRSLRRSSYLWAGGEPWQEAKS